ncbi:MAG TPA: OmpA family protein [Burkholderiales bacterium]|nr:OmpA family protein [Burkholderiales bacterium]
MALALAALTGTAQAKAPGYVADARGQAFTSPFGQCWRTADWTPDKAMPPCDVVATAGPTAVSAAAPQPLAQASPAPERQQLAQAQPAAAPAVRATTGPAPVAGTAPARVTGYVADARGQVWTTPFGLCVRTTQWSPANAVAPCDTVAVVQAAPAPVVTLAPEPPKAEPLAKPEPPVVIERTPIVVAPVTPAPQPPLIEKIDVSTDVLFEFDRAELRPTGRERLAEIAERVKGAEVEQIVAIGHTDRIGPEEYNMGLSERRAEAVREFLVTQGIDPKNIRTEGRGPTEPVTGGQCKGLRGDKLISCLQPDRRVEIEVRGTREVAAGEAPAAAGAGATR